jgi:hypothetical protein
LVIVYLTPKPIYPFTKLLITRCRFAVCAIEALSDC